MKAETNIDMIDLKTCYENYDLREKQLSASISVISIIISNPDIQLFFFPKSEETSILITHVE